MNKTCIISVGTGGYGKGIDRLAQSLKDVGYTGDTMFWKELPEGSPTHEENPYAFKVYAFREAQKKGYGKILWVDASIYAVKPLDAIFDIIDKQGYYLVSNGMNLRQECNDKCLLWFGIRSYAAKLIPMISSGIIGLNFNHSKFDSISSKFLLQWEDAMNTSIFKGSRTDNKIESSHLSFLHHRQDQSAASCIAFNLEMEIEPLGEKVGYFEQNPKDSVILMIHGGF